MKRISLLDQDKKLIKFELKYCEDIFERSLSTGAEIITLKILNKDIKIENGFYIFFYCNSKIKLLEIKNIEERQDGTICYAEFEGIKLRNHILRPFSALRNVDELLDIILADTDIKKGYISESLTDNIQGITVTENTSAYSILQMMIDIYNIEIEYETKLENNNFISYLNIYENGERGTKTYKRYVDGENIIINSKEIDSSNRVSSLVVSGNNGISIDDIEWKKENGFPIDKPLGEDFIVDPETREEIGLIQGNFKSNSSDPSTIIWEAYNKLQEIKKPQITYDCKSVIVTESDDIGDTVYIISDKLQDEVLEEARIESLKLSFSNPSKNEATFQNFKNIKNKIKDTTMENIIGDNIQDIEEQIKYKLTEVDILVIKDYLMQLGLHESEIEELLKKWEREENEKPIPIPPPDNLDDYEPVYLTELNSGLYMGDKVEVLKKATNITDKDDEYYKAIQYYNTLAYQDSKGRDYYLNSMNSNVDKLMSADNEWKLSIIVKVIASTSRIGVDPQILYALIAYNSQGDGDYKWYLDWQNEKDVERYGLVGIPARIFGKKYNIPLGNGNDGSFVPSYDTLDPAKGKDKTVSNVNCNQNIYNQIKLGAKRFRNALEVSNYNVFFAILAYFHSQDSIFDEVYNYIGSRDKAKALIELGKYKADWVKTQKYKEMLCKVLSYYKIVNKQLPFAYDSDNKKIGLGISAPNINPPDPGDENTIKYRVTVSSLNIRSGPGTTYDILGTLSYDEVDVYSIKDGWAKIKYNNEYAYISSQYIEKVNTDNPQPPDTTSDYRKKIVEMAYKVLALGQAGKAWYSQTYRTRNWNDKVTIKGYKESIYLKSHLGEYGWDCSSLAETCYAYAGITTGFTWLSCSGGTIQSHAKKLGCSAWTFSSDKNCSKAKIGDLVMFAGTNGGKGAINVTGYSKSQLLNVTTHHVAVYVGNNEIIHARTYSKGIAKTKLTSDSTAFFISLNKLG